MDGVVGEQDVVDPWQARDTVGDEPDGEAPPSAEYLDQFACVVAEHDSHLHHGARVVRADAGR